jgi:accessory gene regulator protein AgrB
LTPSGIEPAAFWLVVQGLNQLRHRAPRMMLLLLMIIIIIIIIAVTSNVLVLRSVVLAVTSLPPDHPGP